MSSVKPDHPGVLKGGTKSKPADDRYLHGSPGPSDLGVLFVHGIGQQVPGETLYSWGGPLVQWLERWLKPRGGSVDVPFTVAPPASLVPRVPAYAAVDLRLNTEVMPRRILLAETCWAADFPPPYLPHVTKWLLMTASWVIVTDVINLLFYHFPFVRRTAEASPFLNENASLPPGPTIVSLIQHTVITAPLTFAIAITALALSVLQLLLVILGLLSFIPLRIVRAAVRTALLAIQSFLGDSFSISTSSLVRAAVITHIRRDLKWLSRRCSHVIIVAHSQGAALAYEAIRSFDTANVSKLIAFGSGIVKLRELRERSLEMPGWHEGLRYLWILPIVIALMTPHWIAWAAGTLARFIVPSYVPGPYSLLLRLVPDTAWDYFCLFSLVLLYVLTFVLLAAGIKGQEYRDNLRKELEDLPIEYRDFYATHDPVPSGPLVTRHHSKRIITKPIVNRMSVLRDHVGYWDGVDDFILKIVQEIQDSLGLELFRDSDRAKLSAGVLARAQRVKFLLWCRRLLFVAVVMPVAIYFHDVQDLGRSIITVTSPWLPDWLNQAAGFFANNFVGESLLWGLGLIPPVLAAAAWYGFFAAGIWEWWDRVSAGTLFRSPGSFVGSGKLRTFFVFVTIIPPWMSVHFTIRGSWAAVLNDFARPFAALDSFLR